MDFILSQPHLSAVFAIIAVAIYLYASEKLSMELTSILLLSVLMLLFYFYPMVADDGTAILSPDKLLLGFANPALVAVISLLIIGQAVIGTGSLTPLTNIFIRHAKKNLWLVIFICLIAVTLVSGFVNDTPTVVMFIPILMAVASQGGLSSSKVMIPLSYAAILGGVTTLVGSSTNLLVSGTAMTMGLEPIGFFDFTVPGFVIAGVGLLYIILVLPKLLPDRAPLSDALTDAGRQFVAQLEIRYDSEVRGLALDDPELFGDKEVNVKMLQRKEHAYLAPFSDTLKIEAGDIIVVTATRDTIKNLLAEKECMFKSASNLSLDEETENFSLTEILITPASRLIGHTIEQVGFMHSYNCMVTGMQRKSRAITARMTKIRLQAGDILLVMGSREDITNLKENNDMVVMDWSTEELPSKKLAMRVNMIFLSVIGSAAFGVLPIHIGAFVGACAVILTKCISMQRALRAIEPSIIFLVAAGLAMSKSLEATGGASFLAENIVGVMDGAHPVLVMSALFILMALMTNMLSNNATALLFTPIAINTANELGVPPEMFLYAVIFASNCCSFASPIGYQTNLLVMGPGHYKFADYMRAGLPLVFIVWITYTVFSYFYY